MFSRIDLKVSPVWLLSIVGFFLDPRSIIASVLVPNRFRLSGLIIFMSLQAIHIMFFLLSNYDYKTFFIDLFLTSLVLVFFIEALTPEYFERTFSPFHDARIVLKPLLLSLVAYSVAILYFYIRGLIEHDGSVTDYRYFNGSVYLLVVAFAFYLGIQFKGYFVPSIVLTFGVAIFILEEHGLLLALWFWLCLSLIHKRSFFIKLIFICITFLTYIAALYLTHPLFGLRSQEVVDLVTLISFDNNTIFGWGLGFRPPMSVPLDFRGEGYVLSYGFFHLSVGYVFVKFGFLGVAAYLFLFANILHRLICNFGRCVGGLIAALLLSLEIYAGGLVSKYFTSLMLLGLVAFLYKFRSLHGAVK